MNNCSQKELLSCCFCDHVSPNTNKLWPLPTAVLPACLLSTLVTPGISLQNTSRRGILYFKKGQTPESDIPPSYRATRRYTKIHLGFCLRFFTLIGQIGRVPLFGAGPRRYIRSRLFRLAVTAFWRQKGKREQRSFLGPFSSTELPSNPSPLTFRNNQIQILRTSSTHATMAANVSQQDTNTHGTSLSHARTHIQRETK